MAALIRGLNLWFATIESFIGGYLMISAREFSRWRPRHLKLLVWAIVFWGTFVCDSAAQEPALSAEKRNQIEAAVTKFMTSTHVPGLSVAVVENGAFEWAQGFGFADVENNSPASEHTLFRLASISKSLTA